MDFSKFKVAVAHQFKQMQERGLFVTDVPGDTLWETYLKSFPEGTNPVLITRTEHDCSCCRNFVKRIGGLIDANGETIWDIKHPVEPGYAAVAAAMSKLVKAAKIDNIFLSWEKTAGVDKNFQQIIGSETKTWDHFFVRIDKVVKKDDIGTKHSDFKATHDVMARSLKDITKEALETVLELIAQNSLYRGDEHKFAVDAFLKLKESFDGTDRSIWSKVQTTPVSVSRIRNTSIGTLLVAISEGKELEEAVKAFEAMVAPANYKRPTALVTKAQIEKAKATIEQLGLTSALQRRYATSRDISAANVIFANRSVERVDSDDPFSGLETKAKTLGKVEEISIDKFIADVVPKANSIEVFLENRHNMNLVSLIAPSDPTTGRLFKQIQSKLHENNIDVE